MRSQRRADGRGLHIRVIFFPLPNERAKMSARASNPPVTVPVIVLSYPSRYTVGYEFETDRSVYTDSTNSPTNLQSLKFQYTVHLCLP
jgi:hypothetical protein